MGPGPRAAVVAVGLILGVTIAHGQDGDLLAWLEPDITLAPAERARVRGGDIAVQTLPADDKQVAVFAASRLDAGPSMVAAWTRRIGALKEGPRVLAVGRFSDPPTLDDLADLRLDDDDLHAIRDCRPGDCSVKLAAYEMADLRKAAARAPDRPDALQRAFRQTLLTRLDKYRREGLAGLPPYVDRGDPVWLNDVVGRFVEESPYLTREVPALAEALGRPPSQASAPGDSFFFWSKERYGKGKPVVSLTHVIIVDGAPAGMDVLVASTQIYASHYFEGALALTGVSAGQADGESTLVYLNRSQLDILGGFFDFVAKPVIERRVRNSAPGVLRRLIDRFESGAPPQQPPR